MIQKIFAVVGLFVTGLLDSFVPNVESLAATSLPDGLQSSKECVNSTPPIRLVKQ